MTITDLNFAGPRWHTDGLCYQQPDDALWYPSPSDQAVMVEEAKEQCGICPARQACLEWALENDEQGIWGGTSERQRQQLKRNAARKSRAKEAS